MEPIFNSQEIRIQSSFEELGSIVINNPDIDKWPGEAVLCHNDLTPRNLILQSHAFPSGKSKYKLAGIIDWELAGFYPASYELSLQDTYLGANRHVSFYLLLKEHMKISYYDLRHRLCFCKPWSSSLSPNRGCCQMVLTFRLTSGRDSWRTRSWLEKMILMLVRQEVHGMDPFPNTLALLFGD